MQDDNLFRDATGILKVMALGAHRVRHVRFRIRSMLTSRTLQYPSCYPDWVDFIPSRAKQPIVTVRHFSTDLKMVPPAPASPAILAYLTLVNKLSVSWETTNFMKPFFPAVDVVRTPRMSVECDCAWARVHSISDRKVLLGNTLSGAFLPGSLEGVWEGIFTVSTTS